MSGSSDPKMEENNMNDDNDISSQIENDNKSNDNEEDEEDPILAEEEEEVEKIKKKKKLPVNVINSNPDPAVLDDEALKNEKFCHFCSECVELIKSAHVPSETTPAIGADQGIVFKKKDANILYQYLAIWAEKPCDCLYRVPAIVERFGLLIRHLITFCVQTLKNLQSVLEVEEETKEESENKKQIKESWSVEEIEKMLSFMAKVFMLQFPLYAGPKQVGHRFEEPSIAEATQLAVFCDVHEPSDFHVVLLRNVTLFCEGGGLQGMSNAFKLPSKLMPPTMAHALISILFNIKMWLNSRAVLQLFGPVRSNALSYMCGLSDQELRTQPARNMADFLWCSFKENQDSPIVFDKDGLELAFKYFCSTTLTMRLAGITQIINHINIFNDMCNTESVVEVENVGLQLAAWILQNRIVEHLFGPNLHVEVIKQSHTLLNFLAVEGKITNEHVDVIWQSSQLKHCSRQVHDLLSHLIKNLEAGPVLHLYDLMKKLPVKEHTDQTIHLAQILQKFIWTSGGALSNILHEASNVAMHSSQQGHQQLLHHQPRIQSTKSGSISSSDDEEGEDEDEDEDPASSSTAMSTSKPDIKSNVNSKNKKLLTLDKNATAALTTSSDCDYSYQDLDDDLYDDPNAGYSEDEEEVEEEEEEEDDDEDEDEDEDDDLMSTDEEERMVAQTAATTTTGTAFGGGRVDLEKRESVSAASSSGSLPNSETKIIQQQSEESISILPRRKANSGEKSISDQTVPLQDAKKSQESHSAEKKTSLPGKRTKGLPIKGTKRSRVRESSDSESEEIAKEKKISGSPLPGPEQPKKTKIVEGEKEKGEVILGEKAPCWWPSTSNVNHQQSISQGTTSTAMAELANLVNAHPRSARPMGAPVTPEVIDIRPVIRSLAAQRELNSRRANADIDGEGGSVSSRLSDGGLGDFEDENSVDEEMIHPFQQNHEIGAMLQHQQQLANMALYHQRLTAPRLTARQQREEARIIAHYKLESACEKGNTLLWDLLQDENIEELADGIVNEAEKALTNLLCYNMERLIKMKFIEGCLNNIADNKSVAISLRLLPKLIQSFQHFRGMDTHEVCMFIENRHQMTQLFFNNLKIYTKEQKEGKECPYFNHLAQMQIRLQFLTIVFSVQVSPIEMKLTSEQIQVLWECLAYDPVCSDDLFQYLLLQVHSKDQHAIGLDGFQVIYNEKLPTLKPETITMLGLNLFSQLCTLSRLTRPSDVEGNSADNNIKMDQLWKIALCAQNTDVSMKAIQILNSVLFGQGEEFLNTCMSNLRLGLNELDSGRDDILIRIQRALLLLKTYLEAFRRRYAYYLRRMSIEGQGVSTHAELVDLRSVGPTKVVVQAAGFQEKVTLEMQSMDLVADLRAEISAWWEGKLAAAQQMKTKGKSTSPLLGSMLNEGPLRLITQGQELSSDVDEKTLMEIGFKDCQLVFVSQGATRGGNVNSGFGRQDIPPFPGRDKMPMNLLLQPEHFNLLFSLMNGLSNLRHANENGDMTVIPKAQILSRRVWDILMLLPTNPSIKESLQNISEAPEEEMKRLLNPESPQKLMYTFYIVDWLGRPTRLRRHSGVASEQSDIKSFEQPWIKKFIAAGGLKHLFDIFSSGQLQSEEDTVVWCEWKQDCLSALLKLLVQFGVDSNDYESLADLLVESNHNSNQPRNKKLKRHHPRQNSGTTDESRVAANNHLLVPRLSPNLLKLINVDSVMPRLSSVLTDASRNKDPSLYRTGLFGRGQVVHFSMRFLLSWLFSVDGVEDALFANNNTLWLRNLLLDDPDPAVRREVCTGLYKLCLGTTANGKSGVSRIGPLLNILTDFLDDALTMTPMRRDASSMMHHTHMDDGKEPFGPACRDYFWILCRLVDNINALSGDVDSLLDLDQLSRQLACGIVTRKPYEKRHGDCLPDDALVGALNLLCCVMKHEPQFKTSDEGKDFILHLLECLFAVPTPKDKDLPKCKSHMARSACYDVLVEMVKGSLENYHILHEKLMEQHRAEVHLPYPWEYWPQEDGRAECGYVGLTNLGATCYMASCMQQLYMIPQTRDCILRSQPVLGEKTGGDCTATLSELQKMFAYLRESERKAYNPLSFCKNYKMDKVALNTGEQKDMNEFFIDLMSKMEDMSPELKETVQEMFAGTLTNNVVSLDCEHVSSTEEQFYSVRCTVEQKRDLQQSLEEVTVKDTLDGDNKYTCHCGKKVRAEKRACFKRLPKILAFNTMRYMFNFNTMLKEKINTHFSFPFRLDMSPYMEKNLIRNKDENKRGDSKQEANKPEDDQSNESHEFELIGVTVHTGTADGGHYYAFIRDRTSLNKDKWYSFNDAEVEPFDPNQIAAECFGGEMNSRTYDQVTDEFLDLSIEKTNSAYMLFYERVERKEQLDASSPGTSKDSSKGEQSEAPDNKETPTTNNTIVAGVSLSKELEEWIWKDNMNFVQDNNIFDHTYFNFMWQMVGFIPTTLTESTPDDITLLSAKLATSFFLESFIHAKEKLNIVQWVELLTKQFDSSTPACCWFLDHMAVDTNWPTTIFLKCQVAAIRQMLHRLCIHVIKKLSPIEKDNYLLPWSCKDTGSFPSDEIRPKIGSASSVTRFIRMLFSLLDSGSARPHFKYWTEFFRFLYDFAKLGEEETRFLLSIRAISSLVDFYLKTIKQGPDNAVDVISDDGDGGDDDIIALPVSETNKMASLDKMIYLIALLVEKSRGDDNRIHLDPQDMTSLVGSPGKSLVFLFNITKDNINICQTCNLIFSLSRNNQELAEQVSNMVFQGVKLPEYSVHFSRLLNFLTEFAGGPSGMPCYTSLVMNKIWELARICPQIALEWLCHQVSRNRYVQTNLINSMDEWVEMYLMAHPNQKVRNSAALLIVSLVPSSHFKQTFRSGRAMMSPLKEAALTREEVEPLHQILEFLFGLLPSAQNYVDLQQHGSGKLVAFFQAITHCLLSRTEKLMFQPHFVNLWELFHPKLSEPSISIHHNKQALLNLWYTLCVDCPENVRSIVQNPHVVKYIAFNYILADHEDSEVINFNRVMLPAYYGLLRMCCLQSKTFTRLLAKHQNIQWAFKNITPYTTQYTLACDELFKLMTLFVQKYPEMKPEEEVEIRQFRHQTLQLYLSILDGRSTWSTLISVLKILVESDEDRIFVVYNNGFALIFDAMNMLHVMYHEATACHVSGELTELIGIFQDLLKAVRAQRNNSEITQVLSRWKDMAEMAGRLLTLCNSYTPYEMREVCIESVKQMLLLWPQEMLTILVPILHRAHAHSAETDALGLGPFFPSKKPSNLQQMKAAARPPRPMLQMFVPNGQIEASHGHDLEYDKALQRYFIQYHSLIDLIVRLAVNEDSLSKMLVDLSAMVGLDGVPLHFQLFPKLWLDIYNTQQIDRKFITMLLQSHGFLEYVDAVLHEDRASLNNHHIFQFLSVFFPQVAGHVLTDQMQAIVSDLVSQFINMADSFVLPRPLALKSLNGDLRALFLVNSSRPDYLTPKLLTSLKNLNTRVEKASRSIEEALASSSSQTSAESSKTMSESASSESEEAKQKTTDESSNKNLETVSASTSSSKGEVEKPKIKDKEKKEIEEKQKIKDLYGNLLKTLSLLIKLCEDHLSSSSTSSVADAAAADTKDEKKKESPEKMEKDEEESEEKN